MKSASSIQLTKAWWKKEQPEGLKRSAPLFEKAIDGYAKASGALKSPTEKALEEFESALDELEEAGRKVADEAKDLLKEAKKAKDKERVSDLENTVKVMDGPLRAAIAEALRGMPELDDDDDEDDGGAMDPAAHAAFLKKRLPKVKRKPHSFALGLPDNDPANMRMALHPKKGGRSLAGRLKKEAGAKKFTFGRCGGMEFAREFGIEDANARTLVIELLGKKIPSLARRVKIFLRKMKVSAFGRVILVQDGQVLEQAEEDMPDDVELEAVDTAVEDELGEEPGEAAAAAAPDAPEPPLASERAAGLKRRLAEVLKAIATLPKDKVKAFQGVALEAKTRLDAGALDPAEKLIAGLEAKLAGLGAAAAEEAPAPSESEAAGEKILQLIGSLVPRIAALGKAGQAEEARRLGALAKEAQSMVRAGQVKDATAAVKELAAALAAAEQAGPEPDEAPAPEESAYEIDPVAIWNEAKEATDSGLSALQNALRGIGHPDLDRIAEYGLNGAAEGNNARLRAALMSYRMAPAAGKEAAAQKALAEIAAYRSFVMGSRLVDLCENNPFGVAVEIRAPLSRALDRIERALA